MFDVSEHVTRRRALTAVFSGLAGILVSMDRSALADGPQALKVEIMVMHATKRAEPSSYDPRIGDVSRLKEPPFSSFNNYRLLDKQVLSLDVGRNGLVKLPNGRTLQVTHTGLTPDKRHDVSASIVQPDGKEFLKLLRVSAAIGQTFFVAGQSHEGGNLVLAIALR